LKAQGVSDIAKMDKLKKELGDEKDAIRKKYDNLKIQSASRIVDLEGQARDLNGEIKLLKDELGSLRAAAAAMNIPPKSFVSHCVDTIGGLRKTNEELQLGLRETKDRLEQSNKDNDNFRSWIQDLENAVVRADGCKELLEETVLKRDLRVGYLQGNIAQPQTVIRRGFVENSRRKDRLRTTKRS
jgi:chromosome segregation ATPase